MGALGGAPTDLGGGELWVPERDQGERDEPGRPTGAAPVVDHPVVVGLQCHQGDFLVLAFQEDLAAEATDIGKTDGGLGVVLVEHPDPGVALVRPRVYVLVGDRPARHVVHESGLGESSLQRPHHVVVIPDVGPLSPVGPDLPRSVDRIDHGAPLPTNVRPLFA